MNYNNSKVYKIISDHTDKIYIGSTCSTLSKRIYEHKANYKSYQNGKYHNVTSFDLISLGDVDIILIEDYPCKNKNQLHARERYWMEQNKNIIVNNHMPTRTKKEYREENKEQLNEKNKEYYNQNKEVILEKCKDYYIENKEKITNRVKDYRENNYKVISERQKKYRILNSDKIKERKSKICQCECGVQYTHDHLARHIQSQLHQQNIKEQKDKIKLPLYAFQMIVEWDSKMRKASSFTNYIIV